MMGHRDRLIDGDEYDAISRRARKFLRWRAGQRAQVKTKIAKRARKGAKLDLPKELDFERDDVWG